MRHQIMVFIMHLFRIILNVPAVLLHINIEDIGVENNESYKALIYPNPFTDQIKTLFNQEILYIKLIELNGKMIQTKLT